MPTGQQLAEDSLAPKIVLSNVFEVKHESIEVTTEAGQALNYQKNNYFYSDGSQREVTVNWSEVPASSYQKKEYSLLWDEQQVSQCQLLPM